MKNICFMILFLFLPTIAVAFQQVEFKMEFGQEGSGPGQMREPSDIAVDSDGKIFVTDTGNKRINVLGPDGSIIASWSSKENDRGMMSSPSGIVLYEDKVYVTDSDLDKVSIFTRDGKFIDEFGSRGSAPKQFDEPKGIDVHQGIIYVADTGNHRIQTFSLDGIYLQSFGLKGNEIGQLHSPTDVAVDQNGYIYVTEADNNRIQVFDAYGKYYRDYHDVVKPSSLCIDKNGFFVADAGNFQIKKFDFEGHLLVSFGSKGEGQAQFRALSGISLDRDGHVFAVDTKKNTIQKFSPEKYKGASPEFAPPLNSVRWLHDIPVHVADMVWHDDVLYATSQKEDSIFIIQQGMVRKVIMGQGTERLDDPSGIAIDPEGFLWVVDSNNNRVLRLNKDGKVKSIIGSGGKKEGYFSSPQGVAISQKGIVYIADSGNKRVQIFNTEGVYMSKIENVYSEQFERPVDLDVDVSGNIFVVDEDAHRVYVFNAEGRYVQSIGKKGEGDGELKRPTSILVTMDEIFVLDSGNCRIQIFDHNGRFLRKFGTRGNRKGDFIEPLRLALKDETTLFVSDVGNEKIQEFGILYTPRTPLNVKAELGMREINLRWPKGLESFVSHYNIYRSENKVTYELIASPIKPSFVDKNVKLGMTYFYKVSAVAKNGNESGKSDFVAAGIKKILSLPPSEIKVTVGENEILFTWEPDKEGHVASYVMYREIDGRFQEIGRIKTTSFTDKGLKPDTPYLYKITSVSVDDEENEGVPIKATTKKKVVVQLAHIKVFPAVDEITLSWQPDKEGNVASYIIYKEIDGTFKEIGRIKTDSFTDKGLKPNTTYFYKLTAISIDNEESEGIPIKVNTKKEVIMPPTDVKTFPKEDEILLTWYPPKEGNIDSCVIYKYEDKIFREIGKIKTTSFTDSGLKKDVTYVYKIAAISLDGEESRGVVVSATTTKKRVPLPPADMKASPGEDEITLTWQSDREGYIDSYVIYKEVDGTFKEIGRIKTDSFTDKGLRLNTTYIYKVSAVNKDREESQGVIVKATTIQKKPPIDVTVLKIRDISANTYKIYEKEGIGKVRISNNSNALLSNLKVSFMIYEFMNSPSEVEVKDLWPEKSVEIDLKPVFNDKILTLKETALVKAEIKAVYFSQGDMRSYSTLHPVTVIREQRYTAIDENRFLTALQNLDKASMKKPEKEVIQKIKVKLETNEELIQTLKMKGLSYGEIVICIYLMDRGKRLDDILSVRTKGQLWQDVIGSYNIYLEDVTDLLKEVDSTIRKKKSKEKSKTR